jgi:hypothetical protein
MIAAASALSRSPDGALAARQLDAISLVALRAV